MVDFICLGAQKAGTTFLYDYLSMHPDVFMPDEKEIHFFDQDENYNKGVQWYLDHFNLDENSIKGEVSPDYMFYSHVPQRIKEVLGDKVKLIIMLRNPVLRSYSHYNMLKSRNVHVKEDFISEIDLEQIEIDNPKFESWSKPRYCISKSLYSSQIKRFLKAFPKENIHFILFEDIVGTNKNLVLKKLCEFLSIPYADISPENSNKTYLYNSKRIYELLIFLQPGFRMIKRAIGSVNYVKLKNTILNKISSKSESLDPSVQSNLMKKYFLDDITELEKLIGRDLSCWYKEIS